MYLLLLTPSYFLYLIQQFLNLRPEPPTIFSPPSTAYNTQEPSVYTREAK
jgi:hypothetical protein